MLWLLCIIILCIIIVILSVKIMLLRKAADEIRTGFSEKLKGDTNTLISVSSRDKKICRLAADINLQLKELRRERHRFQQGDAELKNAITNISHDLRTPLTAIYGYLDLLERIDKNETVNRYLEMIKDRTEMLKQLTDELFRYSMLISPEQEAVYEPVIINRVLEESIAAFYAALREHGITPDIRIPEEKVIRLLNRPALTRIFSNLLSNALKYSRGDLEITLSEAGEIIFTNTAPELNEVQVKQLFDRFYTVETARKSTGLGLSISKILVEQMGGFISAEYSGSKLSIHISFMD